MQRYVDDIVLVSEDEIADAFRKLLFRGKVLGEPAGVVAAARFLAGRVPQGRKMVALVPGEHRAGSSTTAIGVSRVGRGASVFSLPPLCGIVVFASRETRAPLPCLQANRNRA